MGGSLSGLCQTGYLATNNLLSWAQMVGSLSWVDYGQVDFHHLALIEGVLADTTNSSAAGAG